MIDLVKEYEGNFYRTYSFLDLLNLNRIRQLLNNEEKFYIRTQTILSVYEGHTIFSIYLNYIEVYEKIFNQFSVTDSENEMSSKKKKIESSLARRLYRILKMPTMDLQSNFLC